jgi:hypothetical protein
MKDSHTNFLGWLQTLILLILASQVARITGVSYQHPAVVPFLSMDLLQVLPLADSLTLQSTKCCSMIKCWTDPRISKLGTIGQSTPINLGCSRGLDFDHMIKRDHTRKV